MKKPLLTFFIFSFLLLTTCTLVQAQKQTIVYVPLDNRPVCLDYVKDTVSSTGFTIITPPETLLYTKIHDGNPDLLWQWLFLQSRHADAMILSADTLLYGGLVPSRLHDISPDIINNRLDNFVKLKKENPSLRLYVFSTIMRTPRASYGGLEPWYYEQYASSFFTLTALQDKSETTWLMSSEKKQLQQLLNTIPAMAIKDWFYRRKINYNTNISLLKKVHNTDFEYLAIGLDDNAPYSQTHREMRYLEKVASDLSPTKFHIIPGVDQLGMLLLTRSINDFSLKIPSMSVIYAPGTGGDTIPKYSDRSISKSVMAHIFVAGGAPLLSPHNTDYVLLVNTPKDGITWESSDFENAVHPGASSVLFAETVKKYLNNNNNVVVADVAYANGADNNFMNRLSTSIRFNKLQAYAAWNTADNTIGYAISQGFLSAYMTTKQKDRHLTIRLLDDWAYQANIREELANEIVYPAHKKVFALDETILPALELASIQKFAYFSKNNLQNLSYDYLEILFPWNRLFEIKFILPAKITVDN